MRKNYGSKFQSRLTREMIMKKKESKNEKKLKIFILLFLKYLLILILQSKLRNRFFQIVRKMKNNGKAPNQNSNRTDRNRTNRKRTDRNRIESKFKIFSFVICFKKKANQNF